MTTSNPSGRLGDARQVFRVVGQIRVHLENQIRARLERVAQTVDVRPSEAAGALPMHHFDPSRMPAREFFGDLAGPVRRGVIDDQHPKPRMRENARRENRQILLSL